MCSTARSQTSAQPIYGFLLPQNNDTLLSPEPTMPSVFIDIPKTEILFYLFDNDVDEKMAKKLTNLGLASFSINYPENSNDRYTKSENGLYRPGDFPIDSFPVTSPTEGASFSTTFNREDNSVCVKLKGRFFSLNTLDEIEPIKPWKIGYVWAIKIKNNKGKIIKKPKDQWGMSDPIEGLAEKGVYDGGAHQVDFSVHVEDETYYS